MRINEPRKWLQIAFGLLAVSITIVGYSFATQTGDNSSQYNRNYFSRDPVTANIVQSVENWHLGDHFWKPFSRGQWNYAIDELNFVLEKVPNHPIALEMLGLVAQASGRKALPLRYYEKAVTLFPHEAYTLAQLGDYLVRIDQLDTASPIIEKAIKLNPEIALAYAAQGSLYKKQGKIALAEKAFSQARALGYEEGQFSIPPPTSPEP